MSTSDIQTQQPTADYWLSIIKALRQEQKDAVELDRLFDEYHADRRAELEQWIAEYKIDRAASETLKAHYRRAVKALRRGFFH